ncbi:SET and MYND domain-containing protein DDB_G0292140-like [Artemia franciscana]|uniref:SET domain-containing protein n=1 Tax=Artemia franciscana TaxID=6661 RepID=A0AA88HHU8_ARTSF|nr:hypothetical protein QYM36_011069 [Artemia franciscana]
MEALLLSKIISTMAVQGETEYFEEENVEDSLHVMFGVLTQHVFFDRSKITSKKSKIEFEYYKQKGNQAFVSRDLNLALEDYKTACKFASRKEDLALCYGNMSAVLFEFGKYLKCLEAVSEALFNGYPREKFYKIFKRTQECFTKLGLARILPVYSINSYETLSSILRESISMLKSEKPFPIPNFALKYVGRKDFKRNTDIPTVSEAVSITWDVERGSSMVAVADISPGDLILVEKPVAKSLDLKNSVCYECFVPVQVPYPCENCVYVIFCSPKCKEIALNYHKRECPFLPLIREGDFGAAWAVRLICQSTPQEFIDQTVEVFCGQTRTVYGKICELRSRTDKADVLSKINMSYTTCLVTKLMEDYFRGCTTTIRSRVGLLSDVMYHVAFVTAKLLSASMYNRAAVNSIPLENDGITLGLSYSRINHSCDNNVIPYDIGTERFLVARRPIKKGDEVLTNYHYQFVDGTYYEHRINRHLFLRNYNFDCCCSFCETPPACVVERDDDLTVQILEVHTFICETCKEKYDWTDSDPNERQVCDKCKSSVPFHALHSKFTGMKLRAKAILCCNNFNEETRFNELLNLIGDFHLLCGSPSYYGIMLEKKLQDVLRDFAKEAASFEGK